MNGCNSLTLNNNPSLAARQRLRWTHELHERFVEAVAQLGGPDRELHLVLDLASRLLWGYTQRCTQGKKADKKDSGDLLSSLDGSPGMQITEALKLQMEVQKRLHEQLEVAFLSSLSILFIRDRYPVYRAETAAVAHRSSRQVFEEDNRRATSTEWSSFRRYGSGLSAPASNDNWPASDIKTDPATPAPTSETPLLDKDAKENALAKSISIDESFSSRHEPLTPDSGCHSSSPDESPKGVRSAKKQRVSMDAAYSIPETVLTQRILDSSCSPPYKQPHSLLLAREQ
ncbi:hypothetical protein C3L33_15300, partial [Rhododendron williamsianum]